MKILILLITLLGLIACSDKIAVHGNTPVQHNDAYYNDVSHFTDTTPYFETPYVDAHGVTRLRRVYRPNGLTSADIALGIVAGNMMSSRMRSSGRRPIVIQKTVIHKYEKQRKVRKMKKKSKKTALTPSKRTKLSKSGLSIGKKKRKTGSSSFSLPSKKKRSFKVAKKRSSKKRRR